MPTTPPKTLADLIAVMAALRTPVTGCPWDLEQNFASIARYTIEEAYEVADAIERGDRADLKEELGDLLLQVVYHARLAEEEQAFAFTDVVHGITTKMIRRHPHVFGDEIARSSGMAKDAWERIKAEERAQKAQERIKSGSRDPVPGQGARGAESPSLLADVPVGLPGLTRAVKLQEKAARVGFDWPSLKPVFDKMREELAELEEVVAENQERAQTVGRVEARDPTPHAPEAALGGSRVDAEHRSAMTGSTRPTSGASNAPLGTALAPDKTRIEEEFGDLLFVMANVARHLDIDPEHAVRGANAKFQRRFRHIEARLAEAGKTPAQSDLAEMDALWNEAKTQEKSG